MSLLLLDTNLASHLPHKPLPPWFDLYRGDIVGHLYAVAAQTEAELWWGALLAGWGKARLARLEAFLAGVVVLPAERATAKNWGRAMVAAQHQGLRLSPQDAWVVATAWTHHLPLVTHDAGIAAVRLEGLEVICHA